MCAAEMVAIVIIIRPGKTNKCLLASALRITCVPGKRERKKKESPSRKQQKGLTET